jgi:hypothetical protein
MKFQKEDYSWDQFNTRRLSYYVRQVLVSHVEMRWCLPHRNVVRMHSWCLLTASSILRIKLSVDFNCYTVLSSQSEGLHKLTALGLCRLEWGGEKLAEASPLETFACYSWMLEKSEKWNINSHQSMHLNQNIKHLWLIWYIHFLLGALRFLCLWGHFDSRGWFSSLWVQKHTLFWSPRGVLVPVNEFTLKNPTRD